MKVLSVVGARPQFIKAAPVSRALRAAGNEFLLHTGQHYDREMSQGFFDELGIPEPDRNLGVGSGSHARQTAEMLRGIDETIREVDPDVVLIYGDTNSTLAGALAASKVPVPLAHVEAGLRSRRFDMPEEINRVVADRLAQLLFAPTDEAVKNLRDEGIEEGVHQVGDVMYDAYRIFRARAAETNRIVDLLGLERRGYVLATIHRAGNTDDPSRLRAICAALADVGAPVIFPVHPRTRRAIEESGVDLPPGVRVLPPLGYLSMLELSAHAIAILTDSGGVQKEAYWAGVPCITLRAETEWVETVAAGWNTLVDADAERIRAAARGAMGFDRTRTRPDVYGAGDASERIARVLAAGPPAVPTSRPDARPGWVDGA